jgi:hypothetical protein
MIMTHIVAYLFIIVLNALQFMNIPPSFRAYEIATICNLVVYFVCSLIFCLIVNTIVSKIMNATNSAESLKSSLMNAETESEEG